jgi:hypothetical protein
LSTQSEKICPYPGLRPFTEEESIFFKGREEHIGQIISQLEAKKFLMLTGASGDGKSSLVYAGVIPNARAGFFKAKHNSWVIADFRPERSPLKNLTRALTTGLGIQDVEGLEKKLSHGYSSLVQAYKSTPYYLNTHSDSWKNASDPEKKQLRNKAANLLILVDQFEEFFTNLENFNAGRTSLASQTVINLLLETAKIALAEDLPIYIICTMRSDYIGQCASFRGLPEYIGFSQFFVPRLKRKELAQVIEEPALLSGNAINKRLTELLINELNEGIDQLPVLQHALHQIWKMANEESATMDLIHFARLSGIPASQLPAEDKAKFDLWFSGLPAFKKEYFKNPSLGNVLDAHANELYETAHEFAAANRGIAVAKEDSKRIISLVFKCLTRIDEGRAVRNRMTLQEITNVINDPAISAHYVAAVIDIFREQGNTFVRPFVGLDGANRDLHPDSILDITHESLIRNWNLLVEWTRQEETDLANFLDLKKQMERWKNSYAQTGWRNKRKAKTFLLPKGPLAFFDDWYKKSNVNAFWLIKYDQRPVSYEERRKEAEGLIGNSTDFLSRSKLVFKRKKQWMIGSISFSIVWTGFWLIVSYLEQKEATTRLDNLKFDQLQTKVVAPASYIALGQRYTADIFIAASSSQFTSNSPLEPAIYLGKLDSTGLEISGIYDTVPISGGMGHYSVKTTKPGEQTFEGQIQIKSPSGKTQKYPFSTSYMVAPPSMMVSANAMNVVYVGVRNPLSVSVAGVSPGDLVVEAEGAGCALKPAGPGRYELSVSETGTVTVQVRANIDGEILPVGPGITFRAKLIPDPIAWFGDRKAGKITRQKFQSIGQITPMLENFDFSMKFLVTSFEMIAISGDKVTTFTNPESGNITTEMKRAIQALKKGSKIILTNIKVVGGDDKARDIAPMMLELEN